MPLYDFDKSGCPVCSSGGLTKQFISTKDYGAVNLIEITCVRCGSYVIDTGDQAVRLELDETGKLALSALIRQHNDELRRPYPVEAMNQYEVNIANVRPPTDAIDQIDLFLQHLAKRAPYPGTYSERELHFNDVWRARLFLPDPIPPVSLVRVMLNEGLISEEAPTGMFRLSLTIKGWQRIREIRSRRIGGESAFVAMWFHADLVKIYDEAILPALKEVGYSSYRVDKFPSDNRIDYDIISKIRQSRLMIVDVTGERSGVYYEAGFAQGLGIPVVWTCNESWETKLIENPFPNSKDDPEVKVLGWRDRMHFDTRQFPHIFWKNSEDLRTQLVTTIAGRGLSLKPLDFH